MGGIGAGTRNVVTSARIAMDMPGASLLATPVVNPSLPCKRRLTFLTRVAREDSQQTPGQPCKKAVKRFLIKNDVVKSVK